MHHVTCVVCTHTHTFLQITTKFSKPDFASTFPAKLFKDDAFSWLWVWYRRLAQLAVQQDGDGRKMECWGLNAVLCVQGRRSTTELQPQLRFSCFNQCMFCTKSFHRHIHIRMECTLITLALLFSLYAPPLSMLCFIGLFEVDSL